MLPAAAGTKKAAAAAGPSQPAAAAAAAFSGGVSLMTPSPSLEKKNFCAPRNTTFTKPGPAFVNINSVCNFSVGMDMTFWKNETFYGSHEQKMFPFNQPLLAAHGKNCLSLGSN